MQNNLPQQISTTDIINTESGFWQGWPYQERCLLLEMYSEASRNQCVREVLAQEEQLLIAELETSFGQQNPGVSAQQCNDRIQFLLMLVDGVACRAFGDKPWIIRNKPGSMAFLRIICLADIRPCQAD
ncbi:hypothetical protein [Pantoea rodasii]|uniref:hypothetical protein n=1 Tax=Pantoea rodasii TaxID=1076549 RepID=UPI001FCD3B7C|nr:hypothetical protein [Pantoea rodasii]